MEKLASEGKTTEEALEKLLKTNNVSLGEILYSKEFKKGGLLKSDVTLITAYYKKELLEKAQEFLNNLIKGLNLEAKFEILNKEERSVIKIYSTDNSVLIGKNGLTIRALEILARQYIFSNYDVNFKFYIDVENYREKRDKRIIRLAKQTAKEVLKTKVSATLDSMTSYERRLVHSALSDFQGIKTHSEGTEPNRYTIIEVE